MNNKVRQVLPVGRFVAVALISISEADCCIEIWNGGMPELQMLDAAGSVVDTCRSFSLPLGVVPSHAMEFSPRRFYFSQPGAVLACSDGLIEARDRTGGAFGLPRLLEAIGAAPAGGRIEAAKSALFSFLDGEEYHDDVSLVLAGFGVADSDRVACHVPSASLDLIEVERLVAENAVLWRYRLTLGVEELGHINAVPFVMTFVNDIRALAACHSEVFLILSELFANALDHGVLAMNSLATRGKDGRERYLQERMMRLNNLRSGQVEIDLVGVSLAGQTVLRIRVQDSGKGFDWRSVDEAVGDLVSAKSHGLGLVRSLCASLQYRGTGNEVIAYYLPDKY